MEMTCRNCGGELIEKNSYFECDCCGKRYEKELPAKKTEEKPSPKTVPFDGDEKYETLWKLVFLGICAAVFNYEDGETIEDSLKELEKSAYESIGDIEKIESAERRKKAWSEITGHFLGMIYYLHVVASDVARIDIGKKKETETDEEFIRRYLKFSKIKEKTEAELDRAAADFIRRIRKNTDAAFVKMAAERAADFLAVNFKKQSEKAEFPQLKKLWEEAAAEIPPYYQKKLTAAYWEENKERLEKLEAERASLDNEIRGYNKFVDDAKKEGVKKAAEIQKELDAENEKMEEIKKRLDKLNFFQRKEKERLVREKNELAVTIKNLENKVKYVEGLGERKAEDFRKEHGNRWFAAGLKLTKLEEELNKNRYPGEEIFDEVLDKRIKDTRKKFGYDKFDT